MTILVIGTGAIGQRHANNLRVLGEEVVPYSMKSGGIEGLPAVLNSTEFEAAILCTATQVRNEVIALTSTANLPIYVEKPLAYRCDDLDAAFGLLGPLADRSFIGYMMRYHPAVLWLAAQDLTDIYRFDFTIGHDVNQWRKNWSFKDSYAANPDGGGVLLDLCHELDMAQLSFADCEIINVTSSGHSDFKSVDFASQIAMQGSGVHGTVSMDYLSPISTRIMRAFGLGRVITFDFANDRYETDAGSLSLSIDRQVMFQNTMQDFLRVLRGQTPENPKAPILSKERKSCQFICEAYEKREFKGIIRS